MTMTCGTPPGLGTAFAGRLRRRRQEQGLHKQELAARIGVSLTTIQQYENGQLPKGEFAVRLAGRGDPDRPSEREEDLVMVPLVEARLSAGGGSLETGSEVLRHYAFRHDFLRRKGNPSRMVLLRVSGDSMQPDICHNDVVLIDQDQREPRPGRIYAVSVEDMIYLKIVNAVPGKLILSSVNPAYAPIEADTRDQLGDLVHIIGRAVWVGRELE